MPRPTKPKGPTEVTAYDHDDTRRNIPTADAAATFYDEAGDSLPPLRYPRNPDLDPQLVWKGKDAQDGEDLVVDAPPIYIQEKVVPRALIENLRKQSKAQADDELPSLFDFDEFDTLDELSAVEFYQHDESWKNRMILGDSLQVMGSLAERESLRGKVQMIYIDPPYGIKFGSNWQARASSRDVKDGKLDDAAREAEQIKAFRDTWELGIHSYLSYLRDRLIVARDLLTETGSVFVQIGDENAHLVRSLLDETFGSHNFVSQIFFATTSGFVSTSGLSRAGDMILWYARDVSRAKVRTLWSKGASESGYNWVMLPSGERRPATRAEKADPSSLPEGARIYRNDNLRSQGASKQDQQFTYGGKTYLPGASLHWKASNPVGMQRLAWAHRIHNAGSSLEYVRYPTDSGWQTFNNVWTDTVIGGFTDEKIYVVQTTTKVVGRCMLMCTDPGDLVLDPTCGSGTTATVAEHWGRRWITIDSSRVALALARQRLMGARYPFFKLAAENSGSSDPGEGFVYESFPRITLGSIANNDALTEGMSLQEAEATIRSAAEAVTLLDRPVADGSRARVAGPFTVESLSPHRSVSFDAAEELRSASTAIEALPFEQSIVENLRSAGIQNGRKGERLVFESIDPHAGAYIQYIGSQAGSGISVGIAIGPQYGTVSASFIKHVAREAVENDVPLVAVLGFAFDPNLGVESDDDGFAVLASTRDLGKVKVLVVRMNVDLLMGKELKKTDSANLFTVFGEPDLAVRNVGDQWVVEVLGVDVYDPTSGDVRSNSTKEIALWMVDTDYDGESFFVRHAYFLGENDPFKALKTALKADIAPDAWATLYRSESVPFDTPSTGKIAVKVINDYGDEVMKVLEVG
jgi:adenine-specific DNA-methyltransferase